MIVVPLKEGENIERALKRFKRKFERTGAVRELRGRDDDRRGDAQPGHREDLVGRHLRQQEEM